MTGVCNDHRAVHPHQAWSDASRVQVVSLDDSDPRAPLVRIRTLSAGEVTLTVQAQSNGKLLEDAVLCRSA